MIRHVFPHGAVEWALEEPPALRRLTLSLVAMAAITGVAIRSLRVLALATSYGESWLRFAVMFVFDGIVLFGMTTLFLGNYPVRTWPWRVPAFAAIEVTAEMAMSAIFLAIGVEQFGSLRAAWADWPVLLRSAMVTRIPAICLYALLLAGVVQVVRTVLLRRESRHAHPPRPAA